MEPWRPTRLFADNRSNRMDGESIWKVAAFSCAVAWQRGLSSDARQYRHVHPNRMFHPGLKRQPSTHLEWNSSAW